VNGARSGRSVSSRQPMLGLAGLVLIALSFVLWGLWPRFGEAIPLVLPLGGLVAFALGWICVGAGSRPGGKAHIGALLAGIIYVACGLIWVLAWNAAIRVRGDMSLPQLTDPVQIAATTLTWPWQLAVWLVLDSFN
jgi:hypothetical protein